MGLYPEGTELAVIRLDSIPGAGLGIFKVAEGRRKTAEVEMSILPQSIIITAHNWLDLSVVSSMDDHPGTCSGLLEGGDAVGESPLAVYQILTANYRGSLCDWRHRGSLKSMVFH